MSSAPHLRVAHPPPKPLMLFDGDCHFCRRWIERWQDITADRVDYAPYQEAAQRFPEISTEDCARAVQFIDRDGRIYRAAEAVFHSLGYSRGKRWLTWCYDRLPGFAPLTEFGYAIVARQRALASAVTRLLWGDEVRRPTYFAARRAFLLTLGLAYLFAFISVWWQLDGLMGERGILPARELLESIRGDWPGSVASLALQRPTLCWLNSSPAMLHGLCLVGVIASALLALGFVPIPALLLCFSCYLSLLVPGEFFFNYQWDILLLEVGFVALFLAPWQWRIRRSDAPPVSRVGLFLTKLVLFKLMFMSGAVKLSSGDPSWLGLTALDYHYWTQPLPTVFAWFADQHPEWIKKLCVAVALVTEVIVPFLIWAPRRLRLIAASSLILLQLAIALTGNYCFFNLLTIGLCLLLIDDVAWRRGFGLCGKSVGRDFVEPCARRSGSTESRPTLVAESWTAIGVLALTFPVNAWLLYSACKPETTAPKWIASLAAITEPFRLANGYGLFRVMTKDRPEIVFEGSADAFDWEEYGFKWKPGDLQRAPEWNAPHQPRLDWSMWFAALGSQRDRVVAARLVQRLLQNEPSVLALLGHNPFPGKAPQFIRASLYDYHFTTSGERKRTGAWWRRELRGQYFPTLSLDDFQR